MEKIQAKDFKLKKTRIYNRDQALANDIWLWLGKQLPFVRIMKMIKDKGNQAIYMIYNDIKQFKPNNRLSLFIWKVNNEEIIFADKKKTDNF